MSYQQWKNTDKFEKINIIGTVMDAFTELKKQLKDFLIHTFVKRKQSAHMDTLIAKCDTEHIVLQVDFSENATIASQHEIQSAHWSHGLATLFTGYAWIKRDEVASENKCESFALISDELSHTKHSEHLRTSSVLHFQTTH